MKFFSSRDDVQYIKETYPSGTRVVLHSMQDPFSPIESGMTGTVDFVDGIGQIHMKWDNGRSLALVPGVDSFAKLPPAEEGDGNV